MDIIVTVAENRLLPCV